MADKLYLKIFQNVSLNYSDDLPFIQAFFGNLTLSASIVSCAILSELFEEKLSNNSQWNVGLGKLKFENALPVGHFHYFPSIKVFSRYSASSTSMVTSVTHTDLTDWSLVNI